MSNEYACWLALVKEDGWVFEHIPEELCNRIKEEIMKSHKRFGYRDF